MAMTFNYSSLGNANANAQEQDNNVHVQPLAEMVEHKGKAMLALYFPLEEIAKSKPKTWVDRKTNEQKSGNLAGVVVDLAKVKSPDGKQSWVVDMRTGKGQSPFLKMIPE